MNASTPLCTGQTAPVLLRKKDASGTLLHLTESARITITGPNYNATRTPFTPTYFKNR